MLDAVAGVGLRTVERVCDAGNSGDDGVDVS
jgi:hypothetical protein